MAKKLYDLVAVTGTYQKGGETKKRYLNVGTAFEGEKGGMFLVLQRAINLAGLPFKEGSDSVMISCFEPRDDKGPRVPASEDPALPF